MSSNSPQSRLLFVPPGGDLVEALAKVADADGWVTGAGYVEGVELRVATEGPDAPMTLRGRFNLLSLAGPRRGPFAVMLARMIDERFEVLGGELVRATSGGVTMTVFPATRAVPFTAGKMAASPPQNWARAAAVSAEAKARDEDHHDQALPETGDWVQHFAFGLCEVLMSDGDRLRIRDAGEAKRVREVALSMLRVTGPTESDGKRLFNLERRTPA